MARQLRLVVPGLAHLLHLRALPGLHPFPSADDRRHFLATLREVAATLPLHVHAYAQLADGLRALATPEDESALSHWVQAVGRRYVGAYNRRHGRSGTLWAGRFRCAAVEPGAWTLRALRFVDAASSEPALTSAAQRCGGPRGPREWPLVDPPEYWALGNTPFERQSAYAQLLAEPLAAADVAKIERCLSGGWVCADEPFVRRLAPPGRRRVSPRPRGRPVVRTESVR